MHKITLSLLDDRLADLLLRCHVCTVPHHWRWKSSEFEKLIIAADDDGIGGVYSQSTIRHSLSGYQGINTFLFYLLLYVNI